jgi:Flp pilus assembly protein TadD
MTAAPAAPRPRLGLLAAIVAVVVLAGAVVAGVLILREGPVFALSTREDRNVLLVTIDTLRGDALGAYGGKAATPNLDALAARGARFTFAHAQTVLTLPSHVSILTGRYPYEHGVRDNSGFRVRADEVTLAGRLKSAGFATGAFVSAFPLDQRYGLSTGFDAYDDRISEVGKTTDIAVPERRADATVSSALTWIGSQTAKWFGWVHVYDPHAPYAPPAEWAARYPNDAYAGEVAWTDFALGPLFARLEKESRPTLVIVTADHGESLGEHGEMTHGVFAYEATLHVPLIVTEIVPGERPRRGIVVTNPVRHIDVAPTILGALGVTGTGLPGASLFSGSPDTPSYFESMMPVLARGWAPLRGVIVGREKYIDLPIRELYDLGGDPREVQNLAATRADSATVLLNVLRGFNMDLPSQPGEEPAAARERLRALGYVGGSPAPRRENYGEDDDPKRLIDLDKMLHRASELFLAGQPEQAVRTYQEVITRRKDTADAYRNMAFVLWQTGHPVAAIGTLDAAIKNGVHQRDIVVKLGNYLAETGNAQRAAALLETVPQDDTEALNALGIAYGELGRSADAMRLFTKALELDPTNGLAYQNIGTLHLRAGDVAAAEKSLRQAVATDPSIPGAHTGLGVVLAKTGRRAEAIDEWKRAVDLEPTEYDALYNLTVELAAAGRMDEARTYGEKYIRSAPPGMYAADIAHVRKLLGQQ